MSNDTTPRYDSFVVRLWQEEATGRLLRAEIDHVQSGAVYVARNTGLTWIQHTLDRVLGRDADADSRDPDSPASVTDG